jgi:hypothetical protein
MSARKKMKMVEYFVGSVERLVISYTNATRGKILSNRKKNRIIFLNKSLPELIY